jgi:hypothetical protein
MEPDSIDDVTTMFKMWGKEPKILNEVLQDLQNGGENLGKGNLKFIQDEEKTMLQILFKPLCP